MQLPDDEQVFLRDLVKASRQKIHTVKWVDRDGTDRQTVLTGPEAVRLNTIASRMKISTKELLRQAALTGMGLLVQPAYVLHEDIEAGRFVPVLTDWTLPSLTMNIVFPSRTHLPARTRLFIDALVRHFRDNDLERTWQQVAPRPLQ